MPQLQGFSNNPLVTRDDVVEASKALITPLLPYFSPAKARVRIPEAIGTHFDETAAQLEGFARPLFVVGALIHAGEHETDPDTNNLLQPWVTGFKAGTDPDHEEYWGSFQDRDQRMVEAEMIAFGLLAGQKGRLWDTFDEETKTNIQKWLLGLLGREFHTSNWLWFRVMATVALIKVCGVDRADIRRQMHDDLSQLDRMYLEDGWSSDGIWPTVQEVLDTEAETRERTGKTNTRFWSRQADYYSGSFAIQFSQLLFVKFAADLDPARADKYRQHAREFGAQFWRYFDTEGAAIPFGRSLTYRFACAGFFAALALAEVDDLPEPIHTPGAVKGLLLRHLRWWASRSEGVFRSDSTINIGWTYPNMFLSEDYNSSQSVYWALKSLVVIALVADNPFWTEPEDGHPEQDLGVAWLPAPRQVLCNHPDGNHHFLLNPSQFVLRSFKNSTAKYCKFAYSSSFPLSVAVGTVLVSQIAPDNALFLSRDGTETWATKRICTDAKVGRATVATGTTTQKLLAVSSQWSPWADGQVSVTTTLLPPSDRWPDWHVRVHRISVLGDQIKQLELVEGAFAIHGTRRSDGRIISSTALDIEEIGGNGAELGEAEGILNTLPGSCVVFSTAGASGISAEIMTQNGAERVSTVVSAVKAEANTNLQASRTLIPVAEHTIINMAKGSELVLVTNVFALSSEANGRRRPGGKTLSERWRDQPVVRLPEVDGSGTDKGHAGEDHIQLRDV